MKTVVKLYHVDDMLAQINRCDQATSASGLSHNGACFLNVPESLPARHVSFRDKARYEFAFELK